MNIALVSGNPHLPQVVGGVEVNTHELALGLIDRGHQACVVAKLSLRDGFGLRRGVRVICSGEAVTVDKDLGYPVFRMLQPLQPPTILSALDVAVLQNGPMLELASGFAQIGVPSVAYLHGLGFETWADRTVSLPFRGYIANSQFTAGRLQRAFGVGSVVVPPLFQRERYATEVEGRAVTFINPVPEKGLDLALQIAGSCPEIPFCFVRGWRTSWNDDRALKRQVNRLGNVELRDQTSDMRSVYRETKILLVPSQWEAETWGRVVTEAQFSGIPVLASDRGGLPESVGPGGVVLRHNDSAAVWAEALRRLWFDPDAYSELASAALRHANSPLVNPDLQLTTFLTAVERFTGLP